WPGFGDNMRVLEWMLKRVAGDAGAVETPIGNLPKADDLNLEGLRLADGATDELFRVDNAGWRAEQDAIGDYLDSYGAHQPDKLKAERQRIADALDAEAGAAAPPIRAAAAS
ncbi:MAG: phosphoenolpyruvate carboxykinase domain-containing protein, partial [Rhodanobacteraceae bacterium]